MNVNNRLMTKEDIVNRYKDQLRDCQKIAIIGQMRAGKDTVAEEFYRYGYTPFRFAQGIDLVIEQFFADHTEPNKKNRMLYVNIGEKLREIDPLVWIKHTVREMAIRVAMHKDISGVTPKLIVTDMRQKHEVDILRELGFVIIKVTASEEIRLQRMLAANDNIDMLDIQNILNNPTEQYAKVVVPDFLIVNDSTREQLSKDVRMIQKVIDANTYRR